MKKTLSILLLLLITTLTFAQKPDTSKVPSVKPEVYSYVEQMPEFPGGMPALYAYLDEHLVYPVKLKAAHFEGKVFVRFTVNIDGSLTDISIVRTDNDDFNDEALRVVREMPRWIPGRQKGVAVNVSYALPIRFALPDSDNK